MNETNNETSSWDGEEETNAVGYCRMIVNSALKTIKRSDVDGLPSHITANVFTAFVCEGVVSLIGSVLYDALKESDKPSWSEKDYKGKEIIFSRESFEDQHKKVRSLIGWSNGEKYYTDKAKELKELMNFRHSFAHPKNTIQPMENEPMTKDENNNLIFPDSKWEKTIKNPEQINDILNYMEKLRDRTLDFIKEKTCELHKNRETPQSYQWECAGLFEDYGEAVAKITSVMFALQSVSVSRKA